MIRTIGSIVLALVVLGFAYVHVPGAQHLMYSIWHDSIHNIQVMWHGVTRG